MKYYNNFFPVLLVFLFIGTSSLVTAQNIKGDDQIYMVVINHEEQYSIWPAKRPLAREWKKTGIIGNREKCQNYIEEVWTDMRPLSIQGLKLAKDTQYRVVINHEEQYSIWPSNKNLPRGWKPSKMKGSLTRCQKYIEEVWTDMRPLSLRKE